MAPIGVRVKADEVGAEETLEDLRPPREDAQHLGGGEGDVEEEADARVGELLPYELRHEEELIVMDPHEVAVGIALHHRVGEALVHPLIGVPPLRGRGDAVEEVMKERPQHGVGEAVVVAAHLGGREVDRDAPQTSKLGVEACSLVRADPRHIARPADPQPARTLVRPPEPGGEPACAR